MRTRLSLLAVALGLCIVGGAPAQVKVDPKLPSYEKVDGVSGRLKSIGSDTMNNEMTYWAEGFLKFYPAVQAEIEGKGTSTAPPALISGTASFGPMSREMKNEEIDKFKEKYRYAPTGLPTSIDMLAIYVHKDNPIKGLSMAQVDAIFSGTRKAGYREVTTWGDLDEDGNLGIKGTNWEKKPISLYGRNSASGTYGFFKENALRNGDFKQAVKEQPGSSSVVTGTAGDRYGIGYSGIGYKTADVRAVPIAKGSGTNYVETEPENAYNGKYPLARPLYVYINYKPGSDLDPLRREFIKYLFSKNGQLDVVKSGYLPVPASVAKRTLASVGIK
jgi:phosphate transport system substrate-binding protein